MSTRRVLLSASRVAVSRPGYDVVSPPAISTDYLAVDSSFSGPLRLYQSGILYNRSIASFGTVSFGQTFASEQFPYVWIMPIVPGSPSYIDDLYMKWVSGSVDNYYNPFNVEVYLSYFQLGANGDATNHDSTYEGVLRDWIYAVYSP